MFEEVDLDQGLDMGRCYSRESFKNMVDAEYKKNEKARRRDKPKISKDLKKEVAEKARLDEEAR